MHPEKKGALTGCQNINLSYYETLAGVFGSDNKPVQVPAVRRVGRCQDGCACVKRCHDAGLGDGDRLLLHDLVDGRAVGLVHLVELVDAADS